MKFFLKIEECAEPTVTVVCAKVNNTIKKIEELCKDEGEGDILYGYDEQEVVPLILTEVACFYTKDKKVFASVNDNEYAIKFRIKELLEVLDGSL